MRVQQTWMGATVALLLLFAAQGARGETGGGATPSSSSVVAVFSLSGSITETPKGDDALFGAAGSVPLKDLVARMKKAASDPNVKAVVLQLGSVSIGTAQLEEIRDAMEHIKKSGKEIHAHADSLSTGSYALLSGASRLSVAPTGDLMIMGLHGETPFLRGLLDKIGVAPDYVTCGAYKSAAEMFMLKQPSPEADQMQNWILDSSFESIVKLIAEGRRVAPEKVRAWIDDGLYTAEGAQKAGIIDAVEQHSDFVAHLKSKYGESVKFDKRYGKEKGLTPDLSSPLGVFQLWGEILQGPEGAKPGKNGIAIVYVEGPIMPGKAGADPLTALLGDSIAYSTPIRKALEEVADDDTVKGVVLRVSSPGGSVVASEIILAATKRVTAKKPFVVSMGDVAGSGGYYVACGSDTIFADATTITASIGVVAGKFATTNMWNKVGINWKAYQRGANAGLLGSERTFSETERKKLKAWMDEVYEVFKGHVIAIRGNRLKKPIDELAGGRVFTGQQALELGLVDKIGGLDDAIQFVAEKAQVKDYDVRVVPQPKNFLELLLEDISGGDENTRTLSLSTFRTPRLPSNPLFEAAAPLLQELDPHRAAAIRRALWQLQLMQTEHVLLMTPEIGVRQ